jgi:CHAT domain-containing protein
MLERDSGDLIGARAHLEAALKIIESLRMKIEIQELRSSFLASVYSFYEVYTDLLMRMHKSSPSEGFDAAALQMSERGRARTLLELLAEARADINPGGDPKLVERKHSLQQLIKDKTDRLIRMLNDKQAQAKAAAAKKEIDDLTGEYQRVQAQIRVASPRYAALTQPEPLKVSEIQQLVLDEDTVLLEYALGEERSYLWVMTQTKITSFELPKHSEIDKLARPVYELLTEPYKCKDRDTLAKKRKRIADAEALWAKSAAELSRVLIGPAASMLESKRLLIVGDGILQYIPFAALPDPGVAQKSGQCKGAGVPIIENHEIINLPSASTMHALRSFPENPAGRLKSLAVLADPVFQRGERRPASGGRDYAQSTSPLTDIIASHESLTTAARQAGIMCGKEAFPRLLYSRQEADSIAALVQAKDRLKSLDYQASKKTATSPELSSYRIVHFATHGILNSVNPEMSGIVLSLFDERGDQQDGFLLLQDIYSLKLPAELVVLSACQTALGKEIKGEGLVGITRGFMHAGSPRVIASLWQVDDVATANLMKRFYENMLKGRGLRPAAALREAQKAMRKNPVYCAPHYWAGFIFQGEWR